MTKKSKFFAELKKENNIKKFGVNKIDLSLTSDLNSLVQQADVTSDLAYGSAGDSIDLSYEYENISSRIVDNRDALELFVRDIEALQEQITDIMISLDAMASEIGVNPDSIPEYKAGSLAYDELESALDKVAESLDSLPNIL
jgi:hypothetical protein